MSSSLNSPLSPSAAIVAYYQNLVRGNPYTTPSPTESASTFHRVESEADIREWARPVSSPPPAPRLVQQEFPPSPPDTAALRSRESEEDLREWGLSGAPPLRSPRPFPREPQHQGLAATFINATAADFEPFATSPSSIYSPVEAGDSSIPTSMLGLRIHRNGQLHLGAQPQDNSTASLSTAPASTPPTPPSSIQDGGPGRSDNMQMHSIATELALMSMSLNQLSRRIDNAITTPGALPPSAYQALSSATTAGTGISPRDITNVRPPHTDRRRFGRGSSVYDDDDGWSLRTWSTRSSRRVRDRLRRRWSRCAGRRGAVSMASGSGLRRFRDPRTPRGS